MKHKKAYIIHETNNKYLLCKILNEYNSSQDADKELLELLTHKKKENDLLKDYDKKESY